MRVTQCTKYGVQMMERLKDDGWKFNVEKKLVEILNDLLFCIDYCGMDEELLPRLHNVLLLLDQVCEYLTWKCRQSGGGRLASLPHYSEGVPLYSMST